MLIAVVHARAESNLEAGRWIIDRSIVEYRSNGVPVLSSVFPHINTTVGHYAARMLQAAEPMHGIYLVTHPLAGQAGGIGPEQTELEVFARIKSICGAVE